MNYFSVFEADAGAGISEGSGSVSVGGAQPDVHGEKGTAAKSRRRGEYLTSPVRRGDAR